MQNELDFTGIEVTENPFDSRIRMGPPRYANLLWFSFGGSLVADVLIMTFFGIPFAIGWHVALLWLCLAWSVLGTGSLTHRTGAAFLVWVAGVLPIAPMFWYLSLNDPHWLSHESLTFMAIAIPTYLAFWCYRTFRGRFIKIEPGQMKKKSEPEVGLTSSISTRDWFQLTALCSIPLAIIPSTAALVLETRGFELLMLGILVVPSAFLLPMIDLTCGVENSHTFNGFKYLLKLCAAIAFVSIGMFTVWSKGDFGAALFAALLPLLVYFSTGGFILLGLSTLIDRRYRFGRYLIGK